MQYRAAEFLASIFSCDIEEEFYDDMLEIETSALIFYDFDEESFIAQFSEEIHNNPDLLESLIDWNLLEYVRYFEDDEFTIEIDNKTYVINIKLKDEDLDIFIY